MELQKLTAFLDELLELPHFAEDYSNNGLQVEGKQEVNKIICGVDGCLELFEYAAKCNADFVFVHHGISWGGGLKRWIGTDGKRFRVLFKHDISLYAAHLPLDAHNKYGNNAVLADLAGLSRREPFFRYCGVEIGFAGKIPQSVPVQDLADRFAASLKCEANLYNARNRIASNIAIVSGGGGIEAVTEAAEKGYDTLVTGEMEHIMFHAAREAGIAVIALGHYASENTGIRAIGGLLHEKFGVEVGFADLPTGL